MDVEAATQLPGQLAGKRGAALTLIAGVVMALGLPPMGLWPLIFVSVPFLIFRLASHESLTAGFRTGWLFGFGYFLVGLHWIGFAFLVDAETYLWMMPFAVGGLAAVMACYWGIAAATVVWLSRFRLPPFLTLPVALSVCEWLRGHLMTGFPWAVPGLVADQMGAVVQMVSVIGMTGMTLLVLLWACAPVALFKEKSPVLAIAILATLPMVWGWGVMRERAHPTQFVDGVGLRIVQPNLSQDDKWRVAHAAEIFDGLIAQSQKPETQDFSVTHIIWPESAVPFLIDESAEAQAVLAAALGPDKTLITGSIRRAQPDPGADYFTSIVVFDGAANVKGLYDKWRLVPGGEFLPFAWILEPLGFQRLVSLPGSFTAGTGPKSIMVPGAGLAGMVVCYEVIFPDRLIDGYNRPQWIINVTNDGWFGQSIGPYQHLAQARLRAIEQGLPLVRSANTGVSAVFDPLGRTVAVTRLTVPATLDSRLPLPLQETFYARFGDLVFAIFAFFSMLVAIHFTWKLR